MENRLTQPAPLRVKLIFNPNSGAPTQSPGQLMEIVREMQARDLIPEVYFVEPESDLSLAVKDALHRGFRLFAVSGGDGTIDTVAAALAGTQAVLGIIPTGTQNNVALSLGIPSEIPAAVELLCSGRRQRVDMGLAAWGDTRRPFLEICSVGLLSALFPAADDIQHGNLARVGELVATLVSFPPADLRLVIDRRQTITTQGHVVLVGNMPFVGPHFRMDPESSYADGLLDVLVLASLSTLEFIGSAVQIAGGPLAGGPPDPRIQRYHARSVAIETHPAMPVLVDGFPLGEGPVRISVREQALTVIAGPPAPPAG